MIDFRQLTCPRCKLESPATAEVCDCGYLLTAPPDKQPVMGRVAKGPSTVRAIFAMLGIYVLGVILLAWCVYFLMVYKGWAMETTLFDLTPPSSDHFPISGLYLKASKSVPGSS
jgi:hypothetical protein